MMRQVWKYFLDITNDNQDIDIPRGSNLLHIAPQGNLICLWFEVYSNRTCTTRSFRVFGTGHDIERGDHVGTVIMNPFVWHIYETRGL